MTRWRYQDGEYIDKCPKCNTMTKKVCAKCFTEKIICSKCGFPKNIEREPVIMDSNPLSFVSYEENKCEECGHQADGSTIPAVAKTIRRIANRKNDEWKQKVEKLKEEIENCMWLKAMEETYEGVYKLQPRKHIIDLIDKILLGDDRK